MHTPFMTVCVVISLQKFGFPSPQNYFFAGRPQLFSPKVKKCAAMPRIPSQNVLIGKGKFLPGLL
jgi:hypothetical protein